MNYYVDQINGDDAYDGRSSVFVSYFAVTLNVFGGPPYDYVMVDAVLYAALSDQDIIQVNCTAVPQKVGQYEVQKSFGQIFLTPIAGEAPTSSRPDTQAGVSTIFSGPVKTYSTLYSLYSEGDFLFERMFDGSIVPVFLPGPCISSCETGCENLCETGCETGCETHEENPIFLYPLFPEIIKSNDQNSLLKNITFSLENEATYHQNLIENLPGLVDVNATDSKYFGFLTSFLGQSSFSDWSIEKKRMFIRSLVNLYKSKSLLKSLQAILDLFGKSYLSPVELYKNELYEDFSYTETPDPYSYRIRAARIEFVSSNLSDEGEEVVIEGNLRKVVSIDDHLDSNQVEFLRSFYPIHVLERPYGDEYEFEDDFFLLDDSVTVCESTCETGEQNFSMRGNWIEDLPLPYESGYRVKITPSGCSSVGLEVYLKPYCESSCQSICEAGEGCQATGCQLFCESHCQLICQYVCQTGCQGSCENPCMVSSQ